MSTLFAQGQGPLVIAHRGASARAPENTLAAFEAAARAGADAVELDVRLTADGAAVVLHDADVASTTDGSGLVHELTLAEVKRLDASGGRGSRQEVPTLAEALAATTVALDVEIKNIPGEAAFDSPEERVLLATLAVLEGSAFTHPVLISSFNWLTLERCRELRPDIPTGFLTVAAIDPRAALIYARESGHPFVLPQAPALLSAGRGFVEEAHAAGLRVGAWTVDEVDIAASLFGWGVDAVVTNDPEAMVGVRRAASGQD